MLKIGAVWPKEKNGKEYLSGQISLDCGVTLTDGLNILLFKPREDRERGPIYEVFVSKPRPRTDAPPAKDDDDNIPF